MARKDVQDPRKRSLFEEIVQGVSGFFRELNRELHTPSAREQELVAIHKELDELQGKVQAIVEQDKLDHKALVDMVEQLKHQQEELVARFETLQRSLTPQEISKWKAVLNRLKQLILIVAGAKTVEALYEAVIQEEVYPQLKEKLQQLVDHLDQVLEWPTPPVVTPEPTWTPAQAPPESTGRDAIEHLERLVANARRNGDGAREQSLLARLGYEYQECGQVERAVKYYEHALAMWRGIAERSYEKAQLDRIFEGIWVLNKLGHAYRALGQVKQEIECFKQAAALAHHDPSSFAPNCYEGDFLGIMAWAYYREGQAKQAIHWWQQALTIAHNKRSQELWLCGLMMAYKKLGQGGMAIKYYQQALPIVERICDWQGDDGIDWLEEVGYFFGAHREPELAIDCYQQALDIARRTEDQRGEGLWLARLGNVYHDVGRGKPEFSKSQMAIKYFNQALTIFQETGDGRKQENYLAWLGSAYCRLGKLERGIEYYQRAVNTAQEIGDWRGEMVRLDQLGSVYRSLGQVDRATECFQRGQVIQRERRSDVWGNAR